MCSANGGTENHPKELGLPKCREGSAKLLTWKELCGLGTGWPSSCPAEQDLGGTVVPNTGVSSVLSLQTTQTARQATLGAVWPTGGDNSALVRLQLVQSCTLGSSHVSLSGPTSPVFRCTSQKARLSLFLIKSNLTQGVKF